jgi:aminopeptidase N
MVIGAADFAVNYAGNAGTIPVYSWVYPEDRDKGFYDYALAKDILPFFIKNVGPYAYQKLANVQSKTMFGGMENASAIFYFENSVKGDRKVEALLVHEIAHQWFGNSATESHWQHIWLSEGFATYMTHFYLEKKYGVDSLLKRLQDDRQDVIAFSQKNKRSVVDTTITSNFMQLLNANSYQKGGWVLHMLRRQLGDAVFLQGIKNYYAQYAGKNAATGDFRKVMEITSGRNLQQFFQQWLYTSGQPAIDGYWHYDNNKKLLSVTITQTQETLFAFPLQIGIATGNKTMVRDVAVRDKTTTIKINLPAKPVTISLDPQVNLLFAGTLTEK